MVDSLWGQMAARFRQPLVHGGPGCQQERLIVVELSNSLRNMTARPFTGYYRYGQAVKTAFQATSGSLDRNQVLMAVRFGITCRELMARRQSSSLTANKDSAPAPVAIAMTAGRIASGCKIKYLSTKSMACEPSTHSLPYRL